MKRRTIVTAAVAGGIALLGGTAAAVALPGAASPTAGDHVPTTVPVPNAHAGSHPDGAAADLGIGSSISQLATSSDTTGLEKGATVSSAASHGNSQAGQHAPDAGAAASLNAAPVDTPPVSAPPVDTPPVPTPPVSTPPVSVPRGPLS